MDQHEVCILVPAKKAADIVDISSSSEGDGAAARIHASVVKHEQESDGDASPGDQQEEDDATAATVVVKLTRRGKIYTMHGAY
jgi:hypothetical protein